MSFLHLVIEVDLIETGSIKHLFRDVQEELSSVFAFESVDSMSCHAPSVRP